jgi:hypothetical protein
MIITSFNINLDDLSSLTGSDPFERTGRTREDIEAILSQRTSLPVEGCLDQLPDARLVRYYEGSQDTGFTAYDGLISVALMAVAAINLRMQVAGGHVLTSLFSGAVAMSAIDWAIPAACLVALIGFHIMNHFSTRGRNQYIGRHIEAYLSDEKTSEQENNDAAEDLLLNSFS